jgi:hypothetical protein
VAMIFVWRIAVHVEQYSNHEITKETKSTKKTDLYEKGFLREASCASRLRGCSTASIRAPVSA